MVIFIARKSYLAYIIIALTILTQHVENRIANTLTNVRHTIMYHINWIRFLYCTQSCEVFSTFQDVYNVPPEGGCQ